MLCTHAEPTNMVFHTFTVHVALSLHENDNSKSN
jgi:hypothetical protein